MVKKVLLVLVVAIVIAGGWLLFKPDKAADTENTSTTPQQTNSTTQTDNDFGSSQTITYDDNGFSPQMLTTKAGEKVTIKNESNQPLQFSSADHPTHLKNDELNLDTIAAGESQTFTPTTKGTFGFHNHLDDDHTGTIVIQ